MLAIVGTGVVGDELGIEAVGLVAAPQAAGVVLDPARVDDADPVASLMKERGGEFAIRACGFHDGPRQWTGVKFAHPRQQLSDPGRGVLKAGVVLLLQEEADVEFGLGHINAQADAGRMNGMSHD